jgi:hypothetical protein
MLHELRAAVYQPREDAAPKEPTSMLGKSFRLDR